MYRQNERRAKINAKLHDKTHILNRHSLNILHLILRFAEGAVLNHELLALLEDTLECLTCKDFNSISSYKHLYLLIHSQPSQALPAIEQALQNGSSDKILSLLLSGSESLNLEAIQRFGNNPIQHEVVARLKRDYQQLQEINQQPLLICVKSLTPTEGANPHRIGLEALLQSFTVLLLDEEKNVRRLNEEGPKRFDPYLLQEKFNIAYVVLVPHGGQSEVLVSMSSFYPALSMLKDLNKLSKGATAVDPFKRMSGLPLHMGAFSSDLSQLLIRKVTLDNLETHFNFTHKSFEVSLVDQVLDSPFTARMRDLPAYFLASTSMQSTIAKYLKHQRDPKPALGLIETLTTLVSQRDLRFWIHATIDQSGFQIERFGTELR